MDWNTVWDFLQPLNEPVLIAVFKVIAIAALGLLIIRILNTVTNRILKRSKLEKGAHGLIKTVVRSALYIMLFLVLADSIGIDVTGIVDYFGGDYQIKVFTTEDINIHP